ncbi:unnamed protein product [Cunninghamella blakesleeana]
MTSVRLKLYEILNDGDLWDKARLLKACSGGYGRHILPSFASQYNVYGLTIAEKHDYNNAAYKKFEKRLLDNIRYKDEEKAAQIKQLINEYKTNSKAIWSENLASIQFEQQQRYLSVKSNSYFIKKYKLDDDSEIHCVFLPFLLLMYQIMLMTLLFMAVVLI